MQVLHTTSADGTKLRLGRWGQPGRNILLVHGLAEHLGRYQHVGEALGNAGWQVTAVELRGHGESEGRRGHVDAWMQYIEDFQAAAAAAGADGNPLVVVAHSMGGLVSLDALRTPVHPPVQAVALSNPLIEAAVTVPKWKLSLSGVLSKLLPRLALGNELNTHDLSRSPEIVQAYEQDTLVYSTVTPRWFTEHRGAIARIKAHAPRYTVPLRMMVGTEDRICNHEAALTFARQWGGAQTPAVYDGWYHELFNEPERETLLAELVAWLDGLELT